MKKNIIVLLSLFVFCKVFSMENESLENKIVPPNDIFETKTFIGLKVGLHLTKPIGGEKTERVSENLNPIFGIQMKHMTKHSVWDISFLYERFNFTTDYDKTIGKIVNSDKNQARLSYLSCEINYNRMLNNNFSFSIGSGFILPLNTKIVYSGKLEDHVFPEQSYNVQDSFQNIVPIFILGTGYKIQQFIQGTVKLEFLFALGVLSEPYSKMNNGYEGVGGLWIIEDDFSFANLRLSFEIPIKVLF